MKPLALLTLALLAAPFAVGRAADVKSYQVTGPVIEVNETTLIVQKDDAKWEVARNKKTKGADKVKVGDKVTVYYHMVADEVEVKDGAKAKPEKK